MKTKDLIKMLQEEDPTGEKEVVGENGDIYTAMTLPAYYDGTLQTLIRDNSRKSYYDVIGVKSHRYGEKIVLKTLNFKDVWWDQDKDDPEGKPIIEYDSKETEIAEQDKINKIKKDFQRFLDRVTLAPKYENIKDK